MYDQDTNICLENGITQQCSNYWEDSSCPTDRCQFDNDIDRCHPIGVTLPCSEYWEGSSCPTDRCQFDNDVGRCHNIGVILPCDAYWEASSCPTDRCQFDNDVGRCHDIGATLPCSEYWEGSSCPTDRCQIKEQDDYGYGECQIKEEFQSGNGNTDSTTTQASREQENLNNLNTAQCENMLYMCPEGEDIFSIDQHCKSYDFKPQDNRLTTLSEGDRLNRLISICKNAPNSQCCRNELKKANEFAI